MDIGGFKPVRDGTGHLVGWTRVDPRSGVTQVYNKNSNTIGWAREDSSSGPGYTISSKGNERLTQGSHPEFLLGRYNEKKEEKKTENKPNNWLFRGQGEDGYKR